MAAIMGPMQRDILAAQQEASRQSQARLQAIGGLGGAWSGLLRTIAPRASEGYYGAAVAAPQFGAGVGGAVTGRLQGDQAASNAFVTQMTGTAPGAPGVDAGAVGGVLTGLGAIEGRKFQGFGDAAKTEAEGAVRASEATTQYDVTEEILQAAKVDQGYTQQLVELAQKRPELYFQVLDEIRKVAREDQEWAMEKDKYAFSKKQANREWKDTQADNKLQRDAFDLQRRELGYDVASDKADRAYKYASLAVSNQRNIASMKAAEAKGRQIDAAASRVRGFVVDKQGRFVLDGGKKIKVTDAPKAAKATQNRQKAVTKARTSAFTFGKTLLKDSVTKAGERIGPDYRGQYLARAGVKGVFPDGSTNRIDLAQRSVSFAQAMEQAWAAIDGDNLVQVYGMSASQIRKQIRQALIRAGWKPDGERP